MKRREFVKGCGALGGVAAWPVLAEDAWPAKPIRLIVPFPPAGGTDVLSRSISHAIAAHTKWEFVVDNKPGAGGNIGLDALAKSPPDGYTIGMGQTANLAVNPALYPSMPFDPLKDLAPIVLLSSQPLILVVDAKSPYKTIADLLAAAKASPGKVNMASAGNGTIGHVAGELFQRAAGV
ncbi:MAG TPA: tripartite tricarboxylate transporter substrate-binding protein, partial [Usitatibacter sp.]|nr:tripartite tricarboxylate transporter substrate-binding protein [Usitatibacter sp.]